MSAIVRAKDIKKEFDLWIQIDDPDIDELAYDNLHSKSVKEPEDWKE